MSTENARQKIDSLDFLRALAILYIVGFLHINDYDHNYLIFNGAGIITETFLSIFVFISGYLLAVTNHSMAEAKDLRRYAQKRFLRIYPLYLAALLLFFIFSLISIKSFILHAFLLNMIAGRSMPTLWFVSMICTYYLLLPFLIMRYSLKRVLVISGLIIVALLSMHIFWGIVDLRLAVYLPIFVFGVIVERHSLMPGFLKDHFLVAASFFLYLAATFLYSHGSESCSKDVLQIGFMGAGIAPAIFLAEKLCGILPKRFYENIAYASFCIYLFHRIIFHILSILYIPATQFASFAYMTFLGVPLVCLTSFYMQKWYDHAAARCL